MRATLIIVLALLAALTPDEPAQQACPSGLLARGHMGFTIGCDCTVNASPGPDRPWQFRSAIRVVAVEPGSAAAGRLRPGDVVTAMDGADVTEPEGARRLASLEPGQRVTLTVRRGGRTRSVELVAGSICPQDPRAMGTYAPAPLSAPDPSTLAPAPRPGPAGAQGGGPVPTLPDLLPPGRLGLALACSQCGWERAADDAHPRWHSALPPRVYAIEPGGPAQAAGILPGDVLLAVEGEPITSAAAGAALGGASPGVPLRLQLRRDSRVIDTVLTPVAWTDAQPHQHRYSGSFGGVHVDVQSSQSAAVTVNEAGDEMTVRVDGAVVRLGVPLLEP